MKSGPLHVTIAFKFFNSFSSRGNKVQNLRKGDRIAIEPGYSCRECIFCKSGSYNICRDMKFCATPPIDGNLR